MNLELAKQIIIDEVKAHASYAEEFLNEDTLEVHDWCNGHHLAECGYNGDIITEVEQVGGEDEGSHYHYVFKIDHPEHGVGFIKFIGHYDSWNGTEWYFEPRMCQPKEVVVIEYQDL